MSAVERAISVPRLQRLAKLYDVLWISCFPGRRRQPLGSIR